MIESQFGNDPSLAIKSMTRHVRSDTANGYDWLWRVGKEVLYIFVIHTQLNNPRWPKDNDIYEYAARWEVYCSLKKVRAQPVFPFDVARLFLTGCMRVDQ